MFLDDEQALELFGAHGVRRDRCGRCRVGRRRGASVTGAARPTIGTGDRVGRGRRGARAGAAASAVRAVAPADRPNSSIFCAAGHCVLVRGRELHHREVLRCAGHERGPDPRRVGAAGDRDAADVAHLVRTARPFEARPSTPRSCTAACIRRTTRPCSRSVVPVLPAAGRSSLARVPVPSVITPVRIWVSVRAFCSEITRVTGGVGLVDDLAVGTDDLGDEARRAVDALVGEDRVRLRHVEHVRVRRAERQRRHRRRAWSSRCRAGRPCR